MKPLAERECDYCGNKFYIYHRKRLEQDKIFCSKECLNNYRKSTNPNYKKCAYCGKLVYRRPNHTEKDKSKRFYCCTEHMGKHRKILMLGENNPNYNNIRRKDGDIMYKNGYIYERVISHPFGDEDGWVRQHRLVAEKYLLNDENSVCINNKRYLSPEYDVHHIDFDKHNNDVNNLVVLTRSEHAKIHSRLRAEKLKNSTGV